MTGQTKRKQANKEKLYPAAITGYTKHYEALTLEFVLEWLDELTRACLFKPEYLFVTSKGLGELHRLLDSIKIDSVPPPGPRLSMLYGLHVVILPTLPENTVMAGCLSMDEELHP